jgi:hypothetical protein
MRAKEGTVMFKPLIECLEDRCTPTNCGFAPGGVLWVADNGGAHAVQISQVGANVQILDNYQVVASVPVGIVHSLFVDEHLSSQTAIVNTLTNVPSIIVGSDTGPSAIADMGTVDNWIMTYGSSLEYIMAGNTNLVWTQPTTQLQQDAGSSPAVWETPLLTVAQRDALSAALSTFVTEFGE